MEGLNNELGGLWSGWNISWCNRHVDCPPQGAPFRLEGPLLATYRSAGCLFPLPLFPPLANVIYTHLPSEAFLLLPRWLSVTLLPQLLYKGNTSLYFWGVRALFFPGGPLSVLIGSTVSTIRRSFCLGSGVVDRFVISRTTLQGTVRPFHPPPSFCQKTLLCANLNIFFSSPFFLAIPLLFFTVTSSLFLTLLCLF